MRRRETTILWRLLHSQWLHPSTSLNNHHIQIEHITIFLKRNMYSTTRVFLFRFKCKPRLAAAQSPLLTLFQVNFKMLLFGILIKLNCWLLTLLQPTRNKPKSPLYYQPEINRNVISPTIDDQAEINRNLIPNILVLYKPVIKVFIKLFMPIFHQKYIQEVF